LRTLFASLLVATALVITAPHRGYARVICTTPEGDTYATDSPPPGCQAAGGDAEAAAAPAAEPERPAEAENAESRRLHAISICEQTVAEQLEGAGNLDWPSRDRYRVQERSAGVYDVDGYVETQSPLGDVRKTWSCHATGYAGRWTASAALGGEEKAATSSQPTPMTEAAPAPRMPAPRSAPERVGSCRSLRFRDTYAERYADRGYQIVKGTIENSGSLPIHNVKVCASGLCTLVHDEPPMATGSTKEFSVRVPGLDVVTVTAECAVVEPM
jgi:hypothetical protein